MIGDGHRHFHILVWCSPLDAQLTCRFQRDLLGRLQIPDQQIADQRQSQGDEFSLQGYNPCQEQRICEKTEKK